MLEETWIHILCGTDFFFFFVYKPPSLGYSVGGGGLVTESFLSLCDQMHCSPPGSSVHGISQARRVEWPFPSPGDLPAQGWNLDALHCEWILCWLSHQGSLCIATVSQCLVKAQEWARDTNWSRGKLGASVWGLGKMCSSSEHERENVSPGIVGSHLVSMRKGGF